MKRTLSGLFGLALVSVLTLTGCPQQEQGKEENHAPAAEAKAADPAAPAVAKEGAAPAAQAAGAVAKQEPAAPAAPEAPAKAAQ